MEVFCKNYEFANEGLIKPYIAKSGKFLSDEEPKQETEGPDLLSQQKQADDSAAPVSNPRPWITGTASKQFKPSIGKFNSQNWKSGDELPLSKEQYYELLEIQVFNVLLPWKGLTETLRYLQKEVPMKHEIREQFKRRLARIRNSVVADVALTNNMEIEAFQSKLNEEKQDEQAIPGQVAANEESKEQGEDQKPPENVW
mmetsp:Transcript_13649/g.21369  ORF Transcript_13649/g.21369 Transcript_13649/m.21369 type:complete len:199 (-) Transcript_13649:166-762(-)